MFTIKRFGFCCYSNASTSNNSVAEFVSSCRRTYENLTFGFVEHTIHCSKNQKMSNIDRQHK